MASRRSTTDRLQSEKQLAHQERFQRAAQYAKAKMQDPVAKAEYKEMAGDAAFSNPFAAALGDYLIPPKVRDVKVSEFTGATGSTIPVLLSDNFKTIKLKVVIWSADGSLIESGEALLKTGDAEWKYVTTQALPSLAGVKIVVTAIDRPGHETIFEKLLA